MGKKSKKTRWRTLTLSNGHRSDSDEESNQRPSVLIHTSSARNYHQQHNHHYNSHRSAYYASKYPYSSSQSTPIRKYQNDSSKSTRSNSTTSDHKATFNEDEYTRITTPRQDVLFKKGYLNKPKTYQTQTSTGTSSTANSTSTCTPDHQSADGTEGTDLEYESSQFVFPNGFIDQNGIYYINSFEPFPFVVYNAPVCYPDYPDQRTKRYSTDSLTESVSPQNEEATPPRNDDRTEDTNERKEPEQAEKEGGGGDAAPAPTSATDDADIEDIEDNDEEETKKRDRTPADEEDASSTDGEVFEKPEATTTAGNDAQDLLLRSLLKSSGGEQEKNDEKEETKYSLKPDAEEFIPRTLRPTLSFDPNVQFINFPPPNFIPLHHHHPPPPQPAAFLPPPGIPINFVPPAPRANFINLVPTPQVAQAAQESTTEEVEQSSSPSPPPQAEEPPPPPPATAKTEIDIAKIVSKLEEEAAKQQQQQRHHEHKRTNYNMHHKPYQPNHRGGGGGGARNNPHYARSRSYNPENPPLPPPPPLQQHQQHDQQQRNYRRSLSNNLEQQQQKKPTELARRKGPAATPSPKSTPTRSTQPTPPKPTIGTNRWISVSSRKRRKNKTGNDDEEEGDGEEREEKETRNEDDDQFESFDVNLLEDVVPVSVHEEVVAIVEVPPTEAVPKEAALPPVPPPPPPQVTPTITTTTTTKKKSRKGTHNPPTKRIMITDTFAPPISVETPPEAEPPPIIPPTTDSEATPAAKQKQKKNKNKKRPVVPSPLPPPPSSSSQSSAPLLRMQSVSSSNTTLSSTLDDSYDFLLENTVLEEFDQKTNLEISRELDRIIQKGMYNSLEEKIRALNVAVDDDGFFRTVDPGTIRYHQSSVVERQGFGALPKNNDPFGPRAGEGGVVATVRPSTSTSMKTMGASDFLDAKPAEEMNVIAITAAAPSKRQYPITQAVKDWMTRTRENTPDVEILKSPNTIYREFSGDNVLGPPPVEACNGEDTPTSSRDDDVTIWSVREALEEQEEEGEAKAEPVKCCEAEGAKSDDVVDEEGEEAVEVYESSYGKNEDYLRIKAEIEEQRKQKGNNVGFPRHGNLPYRAICCSIM